MEHSEGSLIQLSGWEEQIFPRVGLSRDTRNRFPRCVIHYLSSCDHSLGPLTSPPPLDPRDTRGEKQMVTWTINSIHQPPPGLRNGSQESTVFEPGYSVPYSQLSRGFLFVLTLIRSTLILCHSSAKHDTCVTSALPTTTRHGRCCYDLHGYSPVIRGIDHTSTLSVAAQAEPGFKTTRLAPKLVFFTVML